MVVHDRVGPVRGVIQVVELVWFVEDDDDDGESWLFLCNHHFCRVLVWGFFLGF